MGIIYKTTPANLKCGKNPSLRSSLDINVAFSIKANNIHNFLYDYSIVDYKRNDIKVHIICKKHGSFYQTPACHLGGQGCPICGSESAAEKLRKEEDTFIKECDIVHKNIYDYSKVCYTNSSEKIEVVCKRHGSFFPIANNHLRGSKCPKCALENDHHLGYNKTQWVKLFNIAQGEKIPLLYIVKAYDASEEFIKIGRSYRTLHKRFGKKPNKIFPYNFKVVNIIKGDVDFIFSLEKKLHKKYKNYKYTPLKTFRGSTECFSVELLKHINYEK